MKGINCLSRSVELYKNGEECTPYAVLKFEFKDAECERKNLIEEALERFIDEVERIIERDC